MSKPQLGSSSRPGQQTPMIMALAGVVILAAASFAAGALGGSGASQLPATEAPGATPAPAFGLFADSYSCGGTAFTPSPTSAPSSAAARSNPPKANPGGSGPGDPNVALAGFVSRRSSILPVDGWAAEGGSALNVVYVAPNTKTQAPFAFVDLGLAGGKWVANAYGDCEPVAGSVATGSSLSSIPWKSPGSIDKAATKVTILFQSDLCGKVFVGTTIWYEQKSVTLTLWARSSDGPAQGAESCSTAAATSPFTVVLAEGIGNRQLRPGPAAVATPADSAPEVPPS